MREPSRVLGLYASGFSIAGCFQLDYLIVGEKESPFNGMMTFFASQITYLKR